MSILLIGRSKVDTVVGDVVIMDNKGLKKLAFPSLKNITGGVLIHGSFDEYATFAYTLNYLMSDKEPRISFPSLQSVGWMNVRPGLKFDCVSLGQNLSSLITTVKKESSLYDIGFTCQTGYAKNSWNSSDPKGNAQATEIPSSVTDGGSVPSTTLVCDISSWLLLLTGLQSRCEEHCYKVAVEVLHCSYCSVWIVPFHLNVTDRMQLKGCA